MDRRFQFKGQCQGIKIYDDYGHHPTEIKAVLKAFREKYPVQKVNVVFQPHRYSRFQSCWQDFLNSFADADQLFVVPVYKAGEEPIEGIDSENFCQQINHDKAAYFSSFTQLQEHIKSELKEGDVLVTLGAGDVWKIGKELCQ